MGIWEPRAIGCDVAVVTGRWGPLRDKLVAESGGAMNEGRTLHVFRAITLVSRHAVADPPSTGTARDALMKAAQGEACMRRWVRRALMRTNATRLLCRCRQPPIAVAGSLRRLPTRPKQPGASRGATTSFTAPAY